jgi:flagellar motor switch protein FliN
MAAETLPNLEMVYDIPMRLSVQLPPSRQSTQGILHLETGSLIELHKLTNDPVDLCINKKAFARGEVVVSNLRQSRRLEEGGAAQSRVSLRTKLPALNLSAVGAASL